MNGFGLEPLKAEGMACHPDHAGGYYITCTDEEYSEQLQKHIEWRGIENVKKEQCSRPHLIR